MTDLHPNDIELLECFEGDADPTTAETIRQHLESCAQCSELVALLAAGRSASHRLLRSRYRASASRIPSIRWDHRSEGPRRNCSSRAASSRSSRPLPPSQRSWPSSRPSTSALEMKRRPHRQRPWRQPRPRHLQSPQQRHHHQPRRLRHRQLRPRQLKPHRRPRRPQRRPRQQPLRRLMPRRRRPRRRSASCRSPGRSPRRCR